jgi:hypothetical protein
MKKFAVMVRKKLSQMVGTAHLAQNYEGSIVI